MAKQYGKNPAVDFAAENLMSFGKSFSRLNGQPLDKSEAWYDLEALKAYAKTDAAFVGQKVFYVDIEAGTVTHYGIEIDGSLKELGAATLGDGKSIDLGDGGILSLHNYGKQYYKYDKDAEGHYTLVVVDDEHPFPAGLQPKTVLSEDGSTIELAWFEPSSTTVEGLSEQMSSLSKTVNTMQGAVTNNTNALKDKVDKVDGKQLSTEDYTTAEKQKLEGIEAGAKANVIEGIRVNGEDQTPVNKIVDITVPTKVSEIDNDSNFIDNTVDNLVNYYKKSETYTKDEVADLIAAVSTLDILVVDELPTENISTTTIYLKAKTDSETDDIYDEYIYVASTSSWEMIGNTVIDLTDYLKKTGDASNTTVQFTAAATRELPVSGESIAIIIGKVVKYLSSLSAVAFSGSYNDLLDKPTSVTAYIATALAAGATEVSVEIPEGGNFVDVVIRDATGEQVMTDVVYSNGVVTISVSEALSTDLSAIVTYYK